MPPSRHRCRGAAIVLYIVTLALVVLSTLGLMQIQTESATNLVAHSVARRVAAAAVDSALAETLAAMSAAARQPQHPWSVELRAVSPGKAWGRSIWLIADQPEPS
jgi:cytochrome oxidase assembly protein ShyY1